MRIVNKFKLVPRPVLLMLILSLAVLMTSLFFTQEHRSYNSDDVAYQVISQDWQPFSGEKVTLGGSNNFVDKLPYIGLMEHVFPSGRKLLFVEATTLMMLGFSLFYVASVYFLKGAKVSLTYTNLLPFVWLASFGYSFAELYLNTIWRGFEMGLSFATFMAVAVFYEKYPKPLKSSKTIALGVLASIAIGIFTYSDPYFLYFTVGTLVLFSALLAALKKISSPQLLFVYGCVALSFVFAQVTGLVAKAAGISLAATYPAQFVAFEQLPNNVWVGLHGLLIAFGADFFGKQIFSLASLNGLVNFGVLVVIFYGNYKLYALARRNDLRRLSIAQLWIVFLGTVGALVFIIYILSTLANLATYRYFVMLVYCFVVLLTFTLNSLNKLRTPAICLLVIAILINIAGSIKGIDGFMQEGNVGSVRNSANYQLIQTAEDRGLTKGYANYWQGAINTYLSRDRVEFLPAECVNGHTTKMHWLINENRFDRPANRSFFVIDPDVISLPTCSEQQLEAQLGQPVQKIIVQDKTILIFNYDIGSRL